MIASSLDHDEWEAMQHDFKGAYLNGDVDHECFMELPPGLSHVKHKVAHLKKGIYGLKQSGRLWNQKIRNALLQLGLTQMHSDTCVYIPPKG